MKGQRIAIVGAGAVGLYYGTRLALNGEDVSFLMRSDFDVVTRQGIRLESVAGDAQLMPAAAFRTAAEIGTVDLVIVAWKATANSLLRETLEPLVGCDTQILTLQNGLGNCERLAELFGPERVLGGLCFVCLNRLSEGFVKHTAGGKVSIGEWKAEEGREPAGDLDGRRLEAIRSPAEAGHACARNLVERFKAAGIPSQLAEDLEAAQWRKLVWNIPFNGLAIAEGGVTTDVLLASPELELTVRSLMSEVIEIAAAHGHLIDRGVIDFEVSRTKPMGPYRPSSMIDFIEGREVEYEAIWGEPLRRAQEAGVSVPHLDTLAKRIREARG